MDKTIKTILAVIGAAATLCAILLVLKKKFGDCDKCGKKDCECDEPETVEDFLEEAAEAVKDKAEEAKDKAEEVKEAVEEAVEDAKEKAEAIVEEFKDYADVELPNE
jgi:hydrogenase maturation factor HypE